MFKIPQLGTFVVTATLAIQSHALVITSDVSSSTSQLGQFEANIAWTGSDLVVELTNNSDPANSGFITGFVMNLPGETYFTTGSTDTSLSFLDPDFGPYSGSPYGNFDYGFSLGGNFLGGGNPNRGIGVGETGTFTLSNWSGFPFDLDMGDPQAVEIYLTENQQSQELDTHFLTRFRGFANEGSDKVPGTPPPDTPPPDTPPPIPPPTVTIPEPGTWMLMLVGLLGLVGLRRRK